MLILTIWILGWVPALYTFYKLYESCSLDGKIDKITLGDMIVAIVCTMGSWYFSIVMGGVFLASFIGKYLNKVVIWKRK